MENRIETGVFLIGEAHEMAECQPPAVAGGTAWRIESLRRSPDPWKEKGSREVTKAECRWKGTGDWGLEEKISRKDAKRAKNRFCIP